jgi:PIN domain nuclease of toxin-antitoxin system
MDVLLDASAIMAIILNEPNREKVTNLTKNAVLLSPEVIFLKSVMHLSVYSKDIN